MRRRASPAVARAGRGSWSTGRPAVVAAGCPVDQLRDGDDPDVDGFFGIVCVAGSR